VTSYFSEKKQDFCKNLEETETSWKNQKITVKNEYKKEHTI
jgi:hypothetical protein